MIHRDLKPANIKVRDDGTVKVLDFGLAKALEREAGAVDLSQSPTVTATMGGTREGVILGTADYMSPEQARGQPVDKRADIWAFGCVLFEMLTGSGDDILTLSIEDGQTRELLATEFDERFASVSRDGELFYRSLDGAQIFAVPIDRDPVLQPGQSQMLFEGDYALAEGQRWRTYDVLPDGRFVVVKQLPPPVGIDRRPDIIFVTNWIEELRARVPTN